MADIRPDSGSGRRRICSILHVRIVARSLLAPPGMSAPRCVLPGVTYLVTRRCSERRFFLRPAPEVNCIIRYCLALAASRHDIALHAYAVLSNHYHLVLTDRRGLLPLFMHDFNLLVARALNAHHAHFEAFWASGSYSAVTLTDDDAIREKIGYALANPVVAGLVCRSELWPGVISTAGEIGAPPRSVRRPPEFFRTHGTQVLPAELPLALVVPPGAEHLALSEVRAQMAKSVAEHENHARQARGARSFLGRRAVLRQRVFERPGNDEPRFQCNPRVAGRDQSARTGAIERLRTFLAAYRHAWERFREGLRSVMFPAGTWKLKRELGVCCEAPS